MKFMNENVTIFNDFYSRCPCSVIPNWCWVGQVKMNRCFVVPNYSVDTKTIFIGYGLAGWKAVLVAETHENWVVGVVLLSKVKFFY